MTTVPDRLLEPRDYMGAKIGLKTILNQSCSNYRIHFNIPYKYNLTNQKIDIPDWLKNYEKKYKHLEIYRTDDYGPITKLLPTLQRIKNNESIIITVDDDLLYMPEMVDYHLLLRKKYPSSAVGFAGISAIDGSCHFCTTLKKDTRVKILEGYKSVSYKREFFNLEEFTNNFALKTWNDDISISAYLGYKNIQKIAASYDNDTDFSPRVESFPVSNHAPTEFSGCYLFRNSESSVGLNDSVAEEWYKLGYLER